MQLLSSKAETFRPPVRLQQDLADTTHLAMGAHPDDNEFMAFNGIGECYKQTGRGFTSVVITDGAGGTRDGAYAGIVGDRLILARMIELQKAANIGDFLGLFSLNYSSDDLKLQRKSDVVYDLGKVLDATRPEVVYIHNLFDDHDTHVAAALRSIDALRETSKLFIPNHVYGCEVTGGLDWYSQRLRLDVSMHPEMARELLYVFESQSDGNRNYPEAILGRWVANAITDRENKKGPPKICFAMELTDLVRDGTSDIRSFIEEKGRDFMRRKLKNLDDMVK